jgi:ABC-2 type transport system ATP-binding protein
MPPVTFVALEGATKRHGVRTLLADVTAGITEGARIGVVGRNGSGKSTLVGVVAGTEPVEAGRVVRLGGLTVGVLPQQDAFPTDATLRSVVLGDRAEHAWAGDARIREVMDGLLGGIAAPAYRDGLDTRLASASGGEARRAALARVLVADPDLLVLDEPTVGLDPVLRRDLWALFHRLAEDGAAVFVSSHVMDEADRCDRLLLMREGRIIADDTPQRIREQTRTADIESAFLALVENAADPA